MAKNYTVGGNSKNGYRSVGDNAKRAGFTRSRQKEVIDQTRQSMKQNGDGELSIQSTKGQYRAADTIPPKKDNFPPRG